MDAKPAASMWSFVQSGLDVLKKDLGEFSTTVNKDTTTAAAEVTEKVQTTVSETVSAVQKKVVTTVEAINDKVEGGEFQDTFLELGQKIETNLGSLLVSDKETGSSSSSAISSSSVKRSSSSAITHTDPRKVRLLKLQEDIATYLEEPAGQQFEEWVLSHPFNKVAADAALSESPELTKMYDQLVPSTMQAEQFWQRYLFRLGGLQEDERKREVILSGVDGDGSDDEEDLDWGADDDDEEDEAAYISAVAATTTDGGGESKEDKESKEKETIDTGDKSGATQPVVASNAEVGAPHEPKKEKGGNDGDGDEDDDWSEWD